MLWCLQKDSAEPKLWVADARAYVTKEAYISAAKSVQNGKLFSRTVYRASYVEKYDAYR